MRHSSHLSDKEPQRRGSGSPRGGMPGGSWLKEPEAGEMSAKGAGTPRFGDFGAGKREGGFAWSEWQGNQSGMAMSGRKMGMRYDFDKMTDRRGTGSLKWDVPERELPMWVADMDFETAPEIVETLHGRVGHGVFEIGRAHV